MCSGSQQWRTGVDGDGGGGSRVRGGFLYKLGGVSYTIRILMYPTCILHVSCMYPAGYMYPESILMYLKCILNVSYMFCYNPREYMYLDILHVFNTYPKRVQDTFWDTHEIRYDTCILGASLVSHWIHVKIHQDTCILDSSSRYIRIHRDTKSRYM
jgi:hypothetical protein